MRIPLIATLTLPLTISGVANAAPGHAAPIKVTQIVGDNAKDLIRNLKLANATPTTVAGKDGRPAKWTFHVASLHCTLLDESKLEAGVGAGDCGIDQLALTGNAALALVATMRALHMTVDAGHAVGGQIVARNVDCTIDAASPGYWSYKCSFEAEL